MSATHGVDFAFDGATTRATGKHYLRWVLFKVGGEPYFKYQGIFDTDFDKYTEDAVALFTSLGVSTNVRESTPDKDDPSLADDPQRNDNFNYSKMDPQYYGVPLGAHRFGREHKRIAVGIEIASR